jgi:hypothetical protein
MMVGLTPSIPVHATDFRILPGHPGGMRCGWGRQDGPDAVFMKQVMSRSSQEKSYSPSAGSSITQEKIPTLIALQLASFIRRKSSFKTSG